MYKLYRLNVFEREVKKINMIKKKKYVNIKNKNKGYFINEAGTLQSVTINMQNFNFTFVHNVT